MKSKLINIGLPLGIIIAIVALVLVAINKYDNQQKDDAVAVTIPVELTTSNVVDNASVGVVITIGNESAEGSQWNQAATGTQVAAERFQRGGAKINIVTANDKGTEDGARAAIDQLASQNVSGIVLASSGPHIQAALEEAKSRGIPVVLPYAQASNNAWSLEANNDDLKQKVVQATSNDNQVIRLDQQGYVSLDVPAETTKPIAKDTDFAQLAKDLASATEDKTKNYAVVVNADSYVQGKFMSAIQALPINAKIYLSSEATSPAFAQTLMKDQDVSIIDAQSPGVAFGDSVSLQADGQGRSMSAYLQMVKILGESSETTTFGDQKFSDIVASADSRSHDAFVAIVRGIEKAESKDPEKVGEAMKIMKLKPSDGVTASELNFTQSQVLDGQQTLLSATVGNLQLRSFNKTQDSSVIWVPQN